MSFVYDDENLPFPKTDLVPLDGGADPTKHVTAVDWNAVSQALTDVKEVIRGALWVGFAANGADPSPPGIDRYVWVDSANRAWLKSGGVNYDLTSGGTPLLVYREGAPDTGPVTFGTWAGLTARITALRASGHVQFRVLFDNSVTDLMSIPASADLSNVELYVVEDGTPAGGFVNVTIQDNVVLTGFRQVRGPLRITNANTVNSPVSDVTPRGVVTLRDGAKVENAVGAMPFFDLSAIPAGEAFSFDLNNLSGIGDTGGGGSPVILVPDVAMFLSITLGIQGQFGVDALTGGAGSFIIPNVYAGSSFFGHPQTVYNGTTIYNQQVDIRWDDRPSATAPISPSSQLFNDFQPFDASGGAIAQLLPELPGPEITAGMMYGAKETGGSAGLTLAPSGANTIDGSASPYAVPGGGCVVLEADGTGNWRVVSVYDPAAGQHNVLYYRPGSTDIGPVSFNSFAGAMARIDAQRIAFGGRGEFTLFVDDELGVAEVLAGTYDITGVKLRGRGGGPRQLLIARSGASFTATGDIVVSDNLELQADGEAPVIDLGDGMTLRVLRGAAITATGTAPAVDVVGASGFALLSLSEQGSIPNIGVGGRPSIRNNSDVALFVPIEAGQVDQDVIEGTNAPSNISVSAISSGARVDTRQPNFAGTLSYASSATPKWTASPQHLGVLVAASPILPSEMGSSFRASTAGGAFDLTLPPAASVFPGSSIILYQVGGLAGQLGLAPDGADTINGAAASSQIGSAGGALLAVRGEAGNNDWLVRELGLPGAIGSGGGGGGGDPVVFEGTLGVNATQWDITGLDGDAHGVYELDARIVIIDSATDDYELEIQPNGSNATVESRFSNNMGSSTTENKWKLADRNGGSISTDLIIAVHAKILAARTFAGGASVPRFFKSSAVSTSEDGVGTSGADQYGNAYLHSVADNLTFLRFLASNTGTMGADSYCVVTRMGNPTF